MEINGEKTKVEVEIEEDLYEFIQEDFEPVMQNARELTFLPRDKNLQEESISELVDLIGRIQTKKQNYIEDGDESAANQSLALLFLTRSVKNELEMWKKLKEEEYEDAWNRLIDAQKFVSDSQKVNDIAYVCNADRFRQKLNVIEQFVFPPQSFLSPGTVVNEVECTICGENYRNCKHVAGKAYSGRLCRKKLKDFIAREVSLVDNPVDKKARVTYFQTEDGMMRNKMTWSKVDPNEREDLPEISDDERMFTGIVMTSDEEKMLESIEEKQ